MPTFPLPPQVELASTVPFARERARFPHYGRYLEDFVPGQVFVHPRGLTLNLGLVRAFASTFHQANPLYLNEPFAQAHGYRTTPASPQLVFNVTLSLGVQNDSEKAVANLGYYHASFLRPVYPGDTLRALTKVMDRQDKGGGKPGIARVRTLALDQHDQVVLQYERKILVAPRGTRPETVPAQGGDVPFPWVEAPALELPEVPVPSDAEGRAPWPTGLTGNGSWLDAFTPGDVIVHANGRTLTDEHVPWTYALGNTHPLHTDRVYSTGLSGTMSGEPIVYGGLVFAWLEGLGSRDVSENAWADLGFTEGYHTQPTVAGDTVAALHRVLAVEPVPALKAGVVTLQLIGVKNVSAAQALDRFGDDLFVKETDKKDLGKEKLPAKIFEIERRLLVKQRP